MSRQFDLYLAGAEQQGWRKMLEAAGSPMAVSFKGLVRRMPKTKPTLLADWFEGDYRLLLDSGGHSFNKTAVTPKTDLLAYAQKYEDFVAANIERVTLVSEFDSVGLGLDWIRDRREAFYDHLPPEKFMAVWHAEWGIDILREDAGRYDVIGLGTTETATGSNLHPLLVSLERAGVHLHGIAMTKPDILRVVPFASASSTSWLSPMQYGDTIVWDGQTMHRYPRDHKDRARRQHKMLIERAGFDAEAIMRDEPHELARFTIWSWMQQAAAIAGQRRPRPSTNPFDPNHVEEQITVTEGAQLSGSDVQVRGDTSVTTPSETRNSAPKRDARVGLARDERVMLPVIGIEVVSSTETDADGNEIHNERRLMRSESSSGRVCNNCYLSDVCPVFAPDMACAFDIPVEAKTAEQRRAIMEGVIEMQTQRVAFLKFAEDRNGGYADPNLSTEMDRLFKLVAIKTEVEDDRDSFEMTIKSRGAATTLERIFGQEAPPRHGHVIEHGPAVDPVRALESKVALRDAP